MWGAGVLGLDVCTYQSCRVLSDKAPPPHTHTIARWERKSFFVTGKMSDAQDRQCKALVKQTQKLPLERKALAQGQLVFLGSIF